MRLNPEYQNAQYELRMINQLGGKIPEAWPHRFRESDRDKIIELMEKRDISGLLKLSIPKFLEND